jgi:hypothetical protein
MAFVCTANNTLITVQVYEKKKKVKKQPAKPWVKLDERQIGFFFFVGILFVGGAQHQPRRWSPYGDCVMTKDGPALDIRTTARSP